MMIMIFTFYCILFNSDKVLFHQNQLKVKVRENKYVLKEICARGQNFSILHKFRLKGKVHNFVKEF